MKITKRQVGEITILSPRGKLDIGLGTVKLRDAVQESLDAAETFLIIDLENVSSADSSGIQEIFTIYTRSIKRGGMTVFLNPSGEFRDPVVLTALEHVGLFKDETRAVTALEKYRETTRGKRHWRQLLGGRFPLGPSVTWFGRVTPSGH